MNVPYKQQLTPAEYSQVEQQTSGADTEQYLMQAKAQGVSLILLRMLIKDELLPTSLSGWYPIGDALRESQGNDTIAYLSAKTGLSAREVSTKIKDKTLSPSIIEAYSHMRKL